MNHVLARAGNADLARLEGLAQGLERVAPKLRQLVQEEHAPMGKGHLPRARIPASSDEAGEARGVVRRTQRPAVPSETGPARVRVGEGQQLELLLGGEPG
jgi:hypothetical protein